MEPTVALRATRLTVILALLTFAFAGRGWGQSTERALTFSGASNVNFVDPQGNQYQVYSWANCTVCPTNYDVAVNRLDSTGKTVLWSVALAGSGDDFVSTATFDSEGNLYVANGGNNTITAYMRGNLTKVARTITQGISGPVALAVGSQ